MKQRLTVLLLLILFLIIPTMESEGYHLIDSAMTISSDQELNAESYTIINGDFIIKSGVTVTIKRDMVITVTKGDIKIDGNIRIYGDDGSPGVNGARGKSGTNGVAGGTHQLTLTADQGEIIINGQIISQGGKGGDGGKGGNTSSGVDAGSGGAGGRGGNGGDIIITARKGKIQSSNIIKSMGGKGGKGGNGGDDEHSGFLWSEGPVPGNGNNGGQGGNGGKIILVGQDVVFRSSTGLNVSSGEGGGRGLGGDAGDSGSPGSNGKNGDSGQDGNITIKGGEIFYGSSRVTSKSYLINLNPASFSRVIDFQCDLSSPDNPDIVLFPQSELYYQDQTSKIFYTSADKPVIRIKVPKDRGVSSGQDILISDIGKFTVTSDETYKYFFSNAKLIYTFQSFDASQVEAGFFSFPLRIKDSSGLNKSLHLNIETHDKNSNNTYKTSNQFDNPLVLYIDKIAPGKPTILTTEVTDLNARFIWNPPTDQGSGVKNYIVEINGNQINANYTNTTYTYKGDYNQQISCRVYARDQVGNLSEASLVKSVYTVPKDTKISSVSFAGNAYSTTGYEANVQYTSMGGKAAKYEIKYFEVTQNGSREYDESLDTIATVISNPAQEGQTLTKTFNNLLAHKWYKFAIRSINQDGSQTTDWSYYGPIQVPNNAPSAVALKSPPVGSFMNNSNATTLVFKAQTSVDNDKDPLTYIFMFRNSTTNDEKSIIGTVIDGEVTTTNSGLVDGTYEWYVTVHDGFIATPVESGKRTLYVDRVRPQQPEFSVDADKTKIRQIVLKNIVVKDSDVEKLMIWSKGYAGSMVQPMLQDLTRQSGTYTFTFVIPDIEGEQTICMKTIDNAGNESEGTFEWKVIYDKTAPQKPSSLTLNGGINSIEIKWAASADQPAESGILTSGVDYYKVEYRLYGSSGVWSEKNSTTNSVIINQIDDNERYEARVTAYDQAGNSSEVIIGDGFALPAVGDFTYETKYEATDNGYQHYIDFTVNSGDFTKYRIKRRDAQSDPDWISNLNLTYRDYCQPHGVYQYIIETSNPNGEGRESVVSTIEIPNHLPDTPQNTVTGFVNQLQPTLGCNSVLDVDGDGLTYYYFVEEVGPSGVRKTIINWEKANDSELLYKPMFNLNDGYTYYYKVGVDDGTSMENGIPQIVSTETSFVLDVTSPEISLSLPEDIEEAVLKNEYVATATVTITASDQNSIISNGLASGLKKLYYYWNGETNNSYTISSGTVIPVYHGINTLYVVAEDHQGNVTEPKSLTFKVDETGPAITNLVLEGTSLNGQQFTTNSSELFAKFELAEADTIVISAAYCIVQANELSDLNNLSEDRWIEIPVHDGIEKNYEILAPYQLAEEEEYYFVVKSTNSVECETVKESASIKIDSLSPVIQITDSTGDIPTKYKLEGMDQLTLQVDIRDSGSGVDTEEFTLASIPDAAAITDWYPDINQLSELPLEDGQEYYLLVKAVDKLGLETVKASVPIYIDSTAPVFTSLVGGNPIPGTDQYQDQWDPTYLKMYWQIADESNLASLRYAIGTTAGSKNVSSQIEGNENGWINVVDWAKEKDFVIENLNLTSGDYYITLEATNEIGLTQLATTNPIIIDTSKEPCPLVKDDGFATGRKQIHFTVTYPVGELVSKEYYYRIIDGNGTIIYGDELITNPLELPSVSITVDESMGVSLSSGQNYSVILGEMEEGQFNPLSYSDGIIIDTTEPVFTAFNDGIYFTADNVHLSWEASDLESGISKYYLKVGTTRNGDELTNGWVDLGTRKSVALQKMNFVDEGLYFATVKVVNRAGLTTEKCGDGFRIDTTPPVAPKVLGESEYTTKLDRLAVSWTWNSQNTVSDVKAYYYDYLTVRDATHAQWKSVESVTGNPLSTSIELTDLNLVNGTTYYVAIKAVDKAGLESIGISKGIIADINAPTTPIIDDLRDYQDFTDQLTAHFFAQDEESQIHSYKYAVGTLEDQTAILDWTQITHSEETVSSLNLVEGEVYFFTALATDNAGHRSNTSRSNGILVDLQKPAIINLQSEGEFSINPKEIFFSWEGVPSHAPIVGYEYILTSDDNPVLENWKTVNQEQILLTATEEIQAEYFVNDETYTIYVRAIDASGKVSDVKNAHITIDSTPPVTPQIIQEGVYQSKNLVLSWRSSDLESGIARYRYGIGTTRGQVEVTSGWITVENTNQTVQITRSDLELKHNQRYYLIVQAQNNTGVWSEIGDNDGFLVDLTPPDSPIVTGPGEYVTSKTIIGDLAFSAQESEVGIKSYRYQIVSASEKDETTTLTGEEVPIIPSATSYDQSVEVIFDVDNLSLDEKGQYYVAVQAKNTLGLWSEVGFSSIPFTVDTIAPVVGFVKEEEEIVTNGESIIVKWTTDEVGQVYSMVGRTLDSYTPEGLLPKEVITTEEQSYDFRETEYGVYYLFLYMTDLAGNPSNLVTQKIRVNEPPYIQVGSCDPQYKGRELILDARNFTVGDHDGEVIHYRWNFGDTVSNTTSELYVKHAYSEIGDYTITLSVIDNDGGVTQAEMPITITNTLDGELVLDEIWSGNIQLKGDITVPQGVTLTVEPGTTIVVPLNKGFVVHGRMAGIGYFSNEIIFTTYTPDGVYAANLWNGIYLSETSIGSQLSHVIVEYAEQGLGLNQQEILIRNLLFKENGIGIHMVNSKSTIRDCRFVDSFYYGIKEEGLNEPFVDNNIFSGSGLAPYYHSLETLLTVEEVNQFLNGSGNSKGVQ